MIFYILQWFWRSDGPWQPSVSLEGDTAIEYICQHLKSDSEVDIRIEL